MGFKTAVLPNVVLNAGVPAAVKAVLEVGALEETVIVQAATEIVQTQAASVSTTLNVKQIISLPLTSRSVMDFLPNLAGVNTPGGNRDSTIQGLPQATINITIDGMNVQDNYLKTGDGFFSLISPRLDAVEEVTMSTAAQGADASGQGAAQIRFVTRSGSNNWRGSGYYYYRNDALNANTWFNKRDGLVKPKLIQNQPGGRLGGPIVRDKAFFFFNYEEYRSPSDTRGNRTILYPTAEQGIFRYKVAGEIREVNLLTLAAGAGQTSTIDPIIAKLLADIRASTGKTGSITDQETPIYQTFQFLNRTRSINRYPTFRLDLNLTDRHRLSGSFTYHRYWWDSDTLNSRDPSFPGFPVNGTQTSERYTYSTTLRSMLGKNLVNEARYGGTGAPVEFSVNFTKDMWSGPLANQGGFQLALSGAGITNASPAPTPSSRNASNIVFEDTLSWLKGAHSLGFGASYTRVSAWAKGQTMLPTLSFGVVTGDPAAALFTTANFPGASNTDLGNARSLYAVLTGRVSQIAGNARLDEKTDQYVYMGEGIQRMRMTQMGFFAQDAWRMRPDLTLNFGLRYELQLPFEPLNNSYSTATIADVWGVTGVGPDFVPGSLVNHLGYLFQPGVLKGQKPTFQLYTKGTKAYNVDWNNLAPSVGAAWTPTVKGGWLRRILGENETVLRGGYSVAFTRNGLSDFSGIYGSNPGVLITVTRNQSLGNLGTLPLLFRQTDRLGPADFSVTRVYPMTDVVTGDVNIFDPNLQVSFARTYTAGIQRRISRTMAVEVRYVGTQSLDGWTGYDYNEVNIIENGFLDEFRLAQANLQANIKAGKGNTFAYTGVEGTSPLPIYLAYFQGLPKDQASDPKKYTSSSFATSSYYNYLATNNPNPFGAAGTGSYGLQGNQTFRDNAIKAGLLANFFVANPDLLGGANITSNGGRTRYNALQIELRRQMSQGVQFNASYVFGRAYASSRYSFRRERIDTLQSGGEGSVDHAFKANWIYELPFGQGKPFLGGVGSGLDRLIGGWQFHGIARIQSGRLIDLGNVRLVNMTRDDVHKLYELRIDSTTKRKVWMMPQDVIDNTVKAFSVSPTSPTGYGALGAPTGRYFAPANGPDCIESIASGYGDCGVRTLVVRGPLFARFDLSLGKRVSITQRVYVDVLAQILNAFNRVNFTPVGGIGSNPDSYEVTGAAEARQVQLSWRISW